MKIISENLLFIDQVLIILKQLIFYINLHDELSDSTITLVNTMFCFLRNMLNEPDIADRVNQSEMVSTFNLIASSNNESLKLNVCNLIAYTAHANDIKEMANLSELLDTVFQSLKTLMNQKSDKTTEIEQLLDTLQGFTQHDQVKSEILKQNAIPLLADCTTQLEGKALVLAYDVIWKLSFNEEIRDILNSYPNLVDRIRKIAHDDKNEPLKRVASGIFWKLEKGRLALYLI
ncbi:unnamed protein product [Rotaria sp. Silwood2]|nr:unnamed protein product [Rotaria sp. Silwood2]CAF2914406.1 unnamed protein product [Rotaria sp. Silwood2]CAF3181471.1 unnamed protein product [Rotaria sp. Silwood2]CAF3322075.1 unnamed protein product [Rotaria sp. Silwood2]CAF4112482.1 unnamed protein product [Rotaria sp. Silwood2]